MRTTSNHRGKTAGSTPINIRIKPRRGRRFGSQFAERHRIDFARNAAIVWVKLPPKRRCSAA